MVSTLDFRFSLVEDLGFWNSKKNASMLLVLAAFIISGIWLLCLQCTCVSWFLDNKACIAVWADHTQIFSISMCRTSSYLLILLINWITTFVSNHFHLLTSTLAWFIETNIFCATFWAPWPMSTFLEIFALRDIRLPYGFYSKFRSLSGLTHIVSLVLFKEYCNILEKKI